VTPTYKVSDRFVVRGDLRFDSANRAVFVRESGALRARQTTVAGNVVFVY
jgi:hypothetical protein